MNNKDLLGLSNAKRESLQKGIGTSFAKGLALLDLGGSFNAELDSLTISDLRTNVTQLAFQSREADLKFIRS